MNDRENCTGLTLSFFSFLLHFLPVKPNARVSSLSQKSSVCTGEQDALTNGFAFVIGKPETNEAIDFICYTMYHSNLQCRCPTVYFLFCASGSASINPTNGGGRCCVCCLGLYYLNWVCAFVRFFPTSNDRQIYYPFGKDEKKKKSGWRLYFSFFLLSLSRLMVSSSTPRCQTQKKQTGKNLCLGKI